MQRSSCVPAVMLAAAALACSDSPAGPEGQGTVVFQLATTGSGATASSALSPSLSVSVTRGADVIVIEDVQLVARKIKLESEDAACEDDDLVAVTGKSGGERDGTANPRPSGDDALPRARAPRALLGPPVERPDHVGDGENPEQPCSDDRRAHERRVAEHLPGAAPVEPVDDHGQLQPDEDEQRRVQQKDEDLPKSEPLQASLGRRDLRRTPAEVEPGRDCREHP